jgi:hypothetical protein
VSVFKSFTSLSSAGPDWLHIKPLTAGRDSFDQWSNTLGRPGFGTREARLGRIKGDQTEGWAWGRGDSGVGCTVRRGRGCYWRGAGGR